VLVASVFAPPITLTAAPKARAVPEIVHDVATVALTANVPVAVAAAWLLALKAANTEATARPNTRWKNLIACFDFIMLPLFSFQMNVTRKALAITACIGHA
jgi:hypothetical protein